MNEYKLSISLSDEEIKAVKKLAKADGLKMEEELRVLLRLQIREEIELQEAQKRGEA